MNEVEIDDGERLALAGDSLVHRLAAKALAEVRRLQHELDNPLYKYAGGRIHRHAILCRNADIDRLREEVKRLKATDPTPAT